MVKKTFCDKCGKESNYADVKIKITVPGLREDEYIKELCTNCTSELRKFIN